MKLLFKQRIFSWFDRYDIYDEEGNVVYVVKGELAWRHCLRIYDTYENEIGVIKERILTWLPKFEIYLGGQYVGCISKQISFFTPRYQIDYNGWRVEGNFFELAYEIKGQNGQKIAQISKEVFHLSDTYVIEVEKEENALAALLFVLAMDAEKCSRNGG